MDAYSLPVALCTAAQGRTCVAAVVVALPAAKHYHPFPGLGSCVCGLVICIKPLCVLALWGVQPVVPDFAGSGYTLVVHDVFVLQGNCHPACFLSWHNTVSHNQLYSLELTCSAGDALLWCVLWRMRVDDHRGSPHLWRPFVPPMCSSCTGLRQHVDGLMNSCVVQCFALHRVILVCVCYG